MAVNLRCTKTVDFRVLTIDVKRIRNIKNMPNKIKSINMKWKEYEFLLLLSLLFGLLISISNSQGFSKFPYNMTNLTWVGLILLVVGLYGIYKAES